MSSTWNLLRTVVVAAIGAEPDFEANQTALPNGFGVAHPRQNNPDTGDNLQEIKLMVLGYNGPVGSDGYATGAIVSGTCDLRIVEFAPHPSPNQPDRLIFAGAAPFIALPTGRGVIVTAKYLHGLTATLANLGGGLAGATSIEILWRSAR